MVIALLAVFLSPLMRQRVEVTEQCLSARYGGQKGAVRWEEARLFAMYNTWGAQKSGSSITYELSSAREIARWNWVQRPNRFRMSMVPTVPYRRLSPADASAQWAHRRQHGIAPL